MTTITTTTSNNRKIMIKELAQSPYLETSQTKYSMQMTIEYLQRHLRYGSILDVGEKNPLTELIKKIFYCEIYNTLGDLDYDFRIPGIGVKWFDNILYSHTIEHQFSPLYTLLLLQRNMSIKTKLFIILPQRPKFLWTKGHFHEIDHYRMKLLLKRAGLKIVSYERKRIKRDWWFYFTGIRPFLRLFFEKVGYYEVVKI